MQLASGSLVGGKYRLERPLSRGGMGSVWVARHARLGSPLAVKFMDAALSGTAAFVARFEREARIAANLDSPHIVKVHDFGVDEGVPYLVMELLHGEDLGARLQRIGRLSLQDAARLLSQAGKALRRAHEAGLVHRDLKPGNLFLARVEDEEIVKILDFGIVKEIGTQRVHEVTETGEVLGSPHYMSPEQIRGDKDLDHRSDLWSLGVILFRTVTGQQPFPGDQLGTVMAKILVDPMPQATRIAPDLPRGVDAFFVKALARERGRRFQSVREMSDALNRIAGVWRAPMESAPSIPDPVVSRTAAGTLAGAAVFGNGASGVRRPSRAPAVIAIGATVMLLGAGAAVTARRLRGADGGSDSGGVSVGPSTVTPAPAVTANPVEITPVGSATVEPEVPMPPPQDKEKDEEPARPPESPAPPPQPQPERPKKASPIKDWGI